MTILRSIGSAAQLTILALLLNKFVPPAAVVFCLAWRQVGWHREYEESQNIKRKQPIHSDDPLSKKASPTRTKTRGIESPPRSKGKPRQRMRLLKLTPALAPSQESENHFAIWIARIHSVLPSYPDAMWSLDKFIILSILIRQSFEFIIAVYNDQLHYPLTCHSILQAMLMFVPMIFSVLGLRVTRAVLAEGASPRYGTLWLVDEPWLLAIIAFFGYIFSQQALYNSYSDHFPECAPRVMQRRFPPFLIYSNPILKFMIR